MEYEIKPIFELKFYKIFFNIEQMKSFCCTINLLDGNVRPCVWPPCRLSQQYFLREIGEEMHVGGYLMTSCGFKCHTDAFVRLVRPPCGCTNIRAVTLLCRQHIRSIC